MSSIGTPKQQKDTYLESKIRVIPETGVCFPGYRQHGLIGRLQPRHLQVALGFVCGSAGQAYGKELTAVSVAPGNSSRR